MVIITTINIQNFIIIILQDKILNLSNMDIQIFQIMKVIIVAGGLGTRYMNIQKQS